MARGPGTWARRALLAVVLVGAAVIPGRASSQETRHCTGTDCRTAGSVLWTSPLSGSWLAEPGVAGTASASGPAYAASGGGLAVLGYGSTVLALRASDGAVAWEASMTTAGVPAGSAVVGVRAFSGVVAVGVQPPSGGQSSGGQSSAGQSSGGQSAERYEVILSAATGRELRVYPAAAYGGAVAASTASTVIVGTSSVTAYANATGRVLWSRGTGSAGQTWRVSEGYVYVASARALRRIDLSTGDERVILPSAAPAFTGTLTAVVDGVALFSSPSGVYAYDGSNGTLLWQESGAVFELADPAQFSVYLAHGSRLEGVGVYSDVLLTSGPLTVADSLYWVSGGVAFGLDENGLGDAWGYDLSSRRVVWTTAALPWPHFFVDLSGLGGSASPGSDVVLLATCAQVGTPASAGSPPLCQRPELVAVLA